MIEDGGGIVVEAGGTLLEQRGDQHDGGCLGGDGKFFRCWAGDRFGEIEQRVILALAEVLGLEQLGQTDDVRAVGGGFTDASEGLVEVLLRLRSTGHLEKRHGEFFRRHGVRPPLKEVDRITKPPAWMLREHERGATPRGTHVTRSSRVWR